MNITPKKKVRDPTVRSNSKSFAVTSKGYPSVVCKITEVIEKTVIKKKHAANVAATMMPLDNFVFTSETNRLAIIAIVKPPNKELMVSV